MPSSMIDTAEWSSSAPTSVGNEPSVTLALVERLERVQLAELPREAVVVARQCLLDWLGVCLAGRDEPLVAILVRQLASPVEGPGCTLIGRPPRVPIETAALINGACGHAL